MAFSGKGVDRLYSKHPAASLSRPLPVPITGYFRVEEGIRISTIDAFMANRGRGPF